MARLLFGPRREWAGNKQSGKQAKRQRSKLAASLRGDLIQRGKPLHELLAREKFPQGRPFLFGAAHLRALFAPLFLSLSRRRHFLLLVSCPPVSPSERDTAPSAHGRHNGNNNNKSANHPAAHCQLSAAALHASNGPAGGRSGRVQTLFSITRLVPLVLQSSSRDELADELADLPSRSLICSPTGARWTQLDTNPQTGTRRSASTLPRPPPASPPEVAQLSPGGGGGRTPELVCGHFHALALVRLAPPIGW